MTGKLLDKSRKIRAKKELWLAVAVSALVIIPALVLRRAPVAGVYVNALAAATLAGLALLYAPARKVAIAAAVIPMSFMVPLTLPQNTPDFTKAAWLYGVLLLLSLTYRYLFMPAASAPKSRPSVTSRAYLTALPQGIVIGQVLGALGFLLLPHTRPFPDVPIVLVLSATAAFAFIEAGFFQGLLQFSATEAIRPKGAMLLAMLLFVALEATVSVNALLVSALAGSSFAALYFRKQNVVPVMFANATMKLLFIGLIVTVAR